LHAQGFDGGLRQQVALQSFEPLRCETRIVLAVLGHRLLATLHKQVDEQVSEENHPITSLLAEVSKADRAEIHDTSHAQHSLAESRSGSCKRSRCHKVQRHMDGGGAVVDHGY